MCVKNMTFVCWPIISIEARLFWATVDVFFACVNMLFQDVAMYYVTSAAAVSCVPKFYTN